MRRPKLLQAALKSLCALALWVSGCVHLLPQKAAPKGACEHIQKRHLTGWIEQIEDHCVAMVRRDDRVYYVARSTLPKGAREGDYLKRGEIQRAVGRQARREVQAMLNKRPPLPRVFVIPGAPASRRRSSPRRITRYRRGRWRRWRAARRTRQKQRELSRYQRAPWRRARNGKHNAWR